MSTDKPRQPVAYGIAAIEGILDEAVAKRYGELAHPAIEHYGGRFIVQDEEPRVADGDWPWHDFVLVEFPSMERLKAWYDSPEYAEARALAPAAFRGRLLMFVEAVKTSN